MISLSVKDSKLAAKIADHNAAVTALDQRARDNAARPASALANLTEIGAGEMRAIRERSEDERLLVAQEALDLLSRRAELLESAIPILNDVRFLLDKELSKARSKAADHLRKGGFAPEDHPKFHAAPGPINHHFNVHVESASIVREAKLALAEVNGVIGAAQELLRDGKRIEGSLLEELETAARMILGVPVRRERFHDPRPKVAQLLMPGPLSS